MMCVLLRLMSSHADGAVEISKIYSMGGRGIHISFLLGLVIVVWCGNIEIDMGSCFDHTVISSAHHSYSNPLGLVNESH